MSMTQEIPYSEDAEKGVLGCLFGDPGNLVPEARATLPVDGFYHPGNRSIYEQMIEYSDKPGRVLDLVTFTTFLADKGLLDKVGGPGYLGELTAGVMIPAQFTHYRAILLDKMYLRRLRGVCETALQESMGYHDDVMDFLSRTENGVFEVLSSAQTRTEGAAGPKGMDVVTMNWAEHLQATYRNRGKITGICTGIHEIDLTLHGIDDSQGEICVLAGRPGMGKTALAATIMDHLASQGVPGAVFSLEMSAIQLMDRVMLGGAEIDTRKALSGMMSREEFGALSKRAAGWGKMPVWINDSAALTTADLRAQVQVLKRKQGIRWIMVDHLHLLKGVGKQAREDERLRLVEAMETLQFLKKQFKLGVFLMVQLNRETDRRKVGEPPVLADLSGSAAIEQYADHILFIHRPENSRKWHQLRQNEKDEWISGNLEFRRKNPALWSDGMKYPNGAGDGDDENPESPGYARQDYEEHASLFVRKNRRGPTPELAVRYVAEWTRFFSRQAKLFSNNAAERQVNYQSKPVLAAAAAKAGDGEDPFE